MKTSSLNRKSKRKPTRVYLIAKGVQTHPDGREQCLDTAEGRAEYALRTKLMCDRQDWRCAICDEPFDRMNPLRRETFDHERPRGMGGANTDDRLTHDDGRPRNAALCYVCNEWKGSRHFHWRNGQYVPVGGQS